MVHPPATSADFWAVEISLQPGTGTTRENTQQVSWKIKFYKLQELMLEINWWYSLQLYSYCIYIYLLLEY